MAQTIQKRIRREFTAGGVVYQQSTQGPLIAFILDPYKRWSFAKGHIESGENAATAARREVIEEMGLKNVEIICPLGTTEINFLERFRAGRRVEGSRTYIRKSIEYFLMQTIPGAQGKPQRSEKIAQIRWVPIEEASTISDYENIEPVLGRALRLIRRREHIPMPKNEIVLPRRLGKRTQGNITPKT